MFWSVFVSLCAKQEVSPNAVAKALGLSSGSVTMWKNGAIPRSTTIKKIADYFGVSPETFLAETDDSDAKKETPAHQMVDERSDPKVARLIELYCQLNQKYRELYLQQLETLALALQDGGQEKNTQG